MFVNFYFTLPSTHKNKIHSPLFNLQKVRSIHKKKKFIKVVLIMKYHGVGQMMRKVLPCKNDQGKTFQG